MTDSILNETQYQPPKRRRWPWIAGIVVAFLLGTGIGAVGGSQDGTDPTAATTVAPSAAPATAEPAIDEPPAPEPEPEPLYDEPVAKDFTLSVRTLEKQCFGSAGCNVTFQIDAGWGAMLDPNKTYEVTYEIKGGEDTLINTMEVTGDEYSVATEEFIGTPSDGAELTAVVTEVREAS